MPIKSIFEGVVSELRYQRPHPEEKWQREPHVNECSSVLNNVYVMFWMWLFHISPLRVYNFPRFLPTLNWAWILKINWVTKKFCLKGGCFLKKTSERNSPPRWREFVVLLLLPIKFSEQQSKPLLQYLCLELLWIHKDTPNFNYFITN